MKYIELTVVYLPGIATAEIEEVEQKFRPRKTEDGGEKEFTYPIYSRANRVEYTRGRYMYYDIDMKSRERCARISHDLNNDKRVLRYLLVCTEKERKELKSINVKRSEEE